MQHTRSALALTLLAACLALPACSYMPSWLGGSSEAKPVDKKDADKRLAVVPEDKGVGIDIDAKDMAVDVPPQTSNPTWLNTNDAMQTGHLGITGLKEASDATIGEGEHYEQGLVPTPVVAGDILYAMDGSGAISAHDVGNLDKVKWTSRAVVEKHEPAIIGGGLALDEGTLYATSGYGRLAAIDAASGKTKWKVNVGIPVRGAPQASGKTLVVVTVDNQTLAYDTGTGTALWTKRGIRETAGYLSGTTPVISGDNVFTAYSSGELTAYNLQDGHQVWTDTLINPERTRASDVFTGIDADPVVMDGIVYAISTSGMMVANAELNGRTAWQQKIDGHDTPWVAGNVIFLIDTQHQLVAMSRAEGKILWTHDFATHNDQKDTTPKLFGPILAGNAVIIVNDKGELLTFRPQDGKALGKYDVADDVAAPPIVANGTLFLVTKNAKVVSYK